MKLYISNTKNMANRKIPANIEEAKSLKNLIKLSKNNTEINKINIMIVYLWWKNTTETRKILQMSSRTVEDTISKYLLDKKNFYKTNFVWKSISKEKEKLKIEIQEMISNCKEKQENLDINDIRSIINKKYKKEVLTYSQARSLIRKDLKCNYQKPYVKNYKQPEGSKKILNERLWDAIIDIWEKEGAVFVEDINNKKTRIWFNIV